MFNYLKALRFLLALKDYKTPFVTVYYNQPVGRFEADIYGPHNKKTIIFIHGMHPLANKDKRFTSVASILASIGFKVVCPLFVSMQRIEIRHEDPYTMADFISLYCKFSGLDSVSIIAPSMGAGTVISCASKNPAKQLIKSMLLIGGFSDLSLFVEDILKFPGKDPYATVVFLKNFFAKSTEDISFFSKACHMSAFNNSDYLKEANEEQLLLLKNSAARLKKWETVKNNYRIIDLSDSFSVKFKSIKAEVFLLHGYKDSLIPSYHSVRTHEECKKYGVKSKLCISKLISHADKADDLSVVEIFKLVDIFGAFFKTVV